MLYKDIANTISNLILQGTYKTDDKLPSEIALAEKYGTTKSTIRKSLKLLVDQGYIRVINQSGYYVNSMDIIQSFNALSLQSFSELYPNNELETKVLFYDEISAPKDIANALAIKEFAPLVFCIRVRIVSGEYKQMESIYMPKYLFEDLNVDVFKDSIMKYVEKKYKIAYSIKKISADQIPLAFEKYLPTFAKKPLLVVEDVSRLRDGRVYQYTQTYHLDHSFTLISHRD